jgi:hypothetical protein
MSEWHADHAVVDRWAEGRAAMPEAASLEQHLLGCQPCRALVAAQVTEARPQTVPDPQTVWNRLRDEIELPKATAVERLLSRVGLAPHEARLVAQAPMFRTEWASAVLAVLIFAGLAAQLGNSRGMWLFLAIAPLVPATAVALCYDPRIEPALEQELTTPYPTLRLVLLRTIAVVIGGLPVLLVLGLLVPGSEPYLWLLPAAGGVAAVLAFSTVTTPLRAAEVIAAVWLITVTVAAQKGAPREVLRTPFVVAYVTLGLLSGCVFALRGRHLREWRQRGGRS